MTDAEFLGVFQRKELGLKLTDQEVTALQSMAGMGGGGGGGSVAYREFIPKLEQFVVNLFKTRWVDDDSGVQGGVWHCVQSKASGWVYVNKNTGVGTYEIPDELQCHVDGQAGQDLIGRALRHFLDDAVAVESNAVVDALTSPALGLHLTDADATSVVNPLISDGTTIDVATFAAGVDQQIQGLHQARSPSAQDWAYINAGTAAGMVWVNKRSLAASRVVPSDVLEVLGRAAGSGEPRGAVAPAIHAAKEEARLHELALKAEIQSARSQLDQLQGLDADNIALGESVDGAQTALEKALAGLQQLQDSYDLVTKLEQTDKIGADNAKERRRELAEHLRGVALEIEQEEQAISAMRRLHKNELDRANKELDNTNGTEAQTRADADELQEEQKRHRARIKSNAAENEALSSIKQKYEELQAEHGKLRVKCDERGFQLKQARTQLSDTLDKNRNLTKSVERLGVLKQSAEISAEKHTTAQEFLAAKTKLLKSKESELAQLHAHIRELQTRDTMRNVLLEELMGGRGKPVLGDVDSHLFTATSLTADKSPGAKFASAASTLSPSSDVVRHRQTKSGKLHGSGYGNLDIIFVLFAHVSQLHVTPHAPRSMFYLVAILTWCGLVFGFRCCDQFGASGTTAAAARPCRARYRASSRKVRPSGRRLTHPRKSTRSPRTCSRSGYAS